MAETREERILIVDDEEINRAILANIFESDYQIVEAENGQEGLERIQDLGDGLSAVLLDVVMPEVDGIEVLRRMHRKGFTQQVPFFLITAAQDDATIQEAYSLGVMDVIGKPVVPYVVQRRVDSVVELFRARKRLGAEVERQREKLLEQTKQLASMGMGAADHAPGGGPERGGD